MVLGLLFRREYRAALRQRRSFRARVVSALLLIAIAGVTGYLTMYQVPQPGLNHAQQVTRAGQAMFLATLLAESALLVFFVPAYVGPAIAEERQQDTLDMLMLTRLRPIEVAAVKALARWLLVLQLLVSGLPAILVTAWLAGLPREAALTVVVLISTSLFLALLAILGSGQKLPTSGASTGGTPTSLGGGLTLASATAGKNSVVGNAQAMAFLLGMGWLIFPPVIAAMPMRTGELWGDLLYEVQRVCTPIAPSSPVSLVTNRAWFTAPGTSLSLEERVALMVGLQLALALPVLLLAAGQLKPREDRANWADPTFGHRPPVGDDPIYWREYELPARRGAGSLGVMIRRLFLILLKALLLSVGTVMGVYLLVVVPLAISLAFLSIGGAAVREAWNQGYFFQANPTYQSREAFNLVVRTATAMVGLIPALVVGSAAGGRITAERDKKNWDIFLMTPLDSRAILGSKVRATLGSLRLAIRLLVISWVAGLVLGVIHPLGVALAAVDLALMVVAGIALSLNLALRPGPPRATASVSAAWNLTLFVGNGAALAVLLISPLEWQSILTWPRWSWLALGAVALVPPAGSAVVGWYFARQLLARFDEWAGRPLTPDPSANPFARATTPDEAPPDPLVTASAPTAPGIGSAAVRAGGA